MFIEIPRTKVLATKLVPRTKILIFHLVFDENTARLKSGSNATRNRLGKNVDFSLVLFVFCDDQVGTKNKHVDFSFVL